jgi:hypothetical protein
VDDAVSILVSRVRAAFGNAGQVGGGSPLHKKGTCSLEVAGRFGFWILQAGAEDLASARFGMSLEIPEEKLSEIKAALFHGQKIQAIKIYRKASEAGLAEAKDAVEKLEKELRSASPEGFSSKPSASGCFGILMMVCAMMAVVVWWLARR